MAIHLHTDKASGVKHYATTVELKRIYNRNRRYRRGSLPPNFPVPAIPDKIDLAEAARYYAIAKAFLKRLQS